MIRNYKVQIDAEKPDYLALASVFITYGLIIVILNMAINLLCSYANIKFAIIESLVRQTSSND